MSARNSSTSTLKTQNLILSTPSSEDLSAIHDFETRNRSHLKKWESTDSANTQSAQKRLEGWTKECEEGRSARFFIRPKNDPCKIIGFCNFTQIFHGSFQACYLGYKMDHEYEGKGLMFEALESAIRYVFKELGIHRIMANYMPINARSANLLQRLGFAVEGYARNYLLINDRWEDHILTALSVEQWKNNPSIENKINSKQSSLVFRKASFKDLEAIIALLFEDQFGQTRENLSTPLSASYLEAFSKIFGSPNDELLVAELNHQVIGVMQITYLQHLTFQGAQVAHIEGVRIQKGHQKKGFGKQFFQWALERAKNHGCHRVQLMTDKRRTEAKKFYEQLGFSASHEGMKLYI